MSVLASNKAPFQPGITQGQSVGGGSSISNPHPDYSARLPDWVTMFDTNEGQRYIKSKRELYLPATSGMRALGLKQKQEGTALYAAYLIRAFYPDLVKETIRALVGIIDRKPANIELPEGLEDMRSIATPKGESLDELLMQIHLNQLLYGRIGILADVDPNRDLPVLIGYPAPQVINWDDVTNTGTDQQLDDSKRSEALRRLLMVVLNESRFERDTGDRFTWNQVERYRSLSLGEAEQNVYTTQVERDGAKQAAIQPAIRGKTLEEIPFVFCNTNDLATKPGEVPLINLANLGLAIYRGEADHRSALFMSGQDTLVLIGVDLSASDGENPNSDTKPIIGSGAYLNIPDSDGDAKFIGPDSEALAEQRTSLEDDYTRAGEEGIKLLSSGSGAEAAETLHIRVAARTATLQTIANTSAAALETILRTCAVWVGANPEDVKVTPNLDFIDEVADVGDLVKMAQAKKSGMPLSWKSIHNWLKQKEFTDMEFDDELTVIGEEESDDRLGPPDGGLGEDGIDPLTGEPIVQGGQGGQGSDEDEDDQE